MQLMGDWDISSILGADKSFVNGGDLGMAPFPTVAGGTGNPADLAGNTASYVGISSHASAAQKAVAAAFFRSELASAATPRPKSRPARCRSPRARPRLFAGQPLESFDTTIYDSVQSAPSFQYSWDQAMTPQVADAMLTNLAQVFELSQTPQKFESLLDSQAASSS